MPPSEKEIAIACLQPRISEWGKTELTNEMIKLIGQTHINCGFKADKEQIALSIDELVSDLQKYNGTLSFSELLIAFKNGYKKEYGDFFGLSNATYFQWVNAYTWGEKRLRVKKLLSEAVNKVKQPTELTQEEKDAIIRGGAIEDFRSYSETKILQDAGNVTYNYLDRMGLITFTAEVKRGFIEQAKKRLIEKKRGTMDNSSATDKRIIADEIKAITDGKSPTLIAEAKREALRAYFDNLIEIGTSIEDQLQLSKERQKDKP